MKVIIMRGIPGSGKSTYIKEHFPNAIVCSADHFFVDETGNYNFNPNKIGEAHLACQRKFTDLVLTRSAQGEVVVVDNTNTQLYEMAFYIGLCNVYDIPFEIHRMDTPAEIAAARNVHGVPPERVRQMAARMESVPPFIGKELIVSGG